jgi:hypothetical protein
MVFGGVRRGGGGAVAMAATTQGTAMILWEPVSWALFGVVHGCGLYMLYMLVVPGCSC